MRNWSLGGKLMVRDDGGAGCELVKASKGTREPKEVIITMLESTCVFV